MKIDSPHEVFSSRRIEPDGSGSWEICNCLIHLRRVGHDWLVGHERQPFGSNQLAYLGTDHVPESAINWKRWSFHQEDENVSLRPVLPDRPLVVRPQNPLTLAPRSEVLFFVSIPMWIQVTLGKECLVIDTIPTVILSNTWFGLPTEGELCYALKSGASRTLGQSNPSPARMICPLLLRNQATDPFSVNKLSLPTNFFGVYKGETRFWTNEIVLTYQGHNRFGSVQPINQEPHYEKITHTLSAPRILHKESLVRRTFGGLMSGFGLI